MKIQQIDISKLKPAPYNPREISDESLDRLRKSLDQFGSVEPLVWNKKTGHVVGGNQRLKMYQEQGLKKVSCSVVELSSKQEKILNLRLNNLSGTWDWPKVGDLLKSLDKADWPLTGFDDCDIAPLVAGDLGGNGSDPKTLCEQFGVPPFSVLDARQGYWQDRKRAWLALGIQSELGRGEQSSTSARAEPGQRPTYRQIKGGGSKDGDAERPDAKKRQVRRANATPGGSLMPAANYSKTRARGDGKGRPIR